MDSRLKLEATPFRRFAAAFVAVVMLATSFAMPTRSFAFDTGNTPVQGQFANHDKSVPKPCRKAILPGTGSACSVVTVGISPLAADAVASPAPETSGDAVWRMGDVSLAPQCGGFSPYRPPCLSV